MDKPSCSGIKPFPCYKCPKSFKTKSDMYRHRRQKHSDNFPYKCEDCKKTFKTRGQLVKHVRVHVLPFICACKKRFYTKEELDEHKVIHLTDRPFPCDRCPKRFKTNADITRHKKQVHSDERGFKCRACDVGFTTRKTLNQHLKIHIDPYLCPYCSDRLFNKIRFEEHIAKVHKVERPFECPKCGKWFKRKTNLRVHIRRHEGRLPFPCTKCTKSFHTAAMLERHIRTNCKPRPISCAHCDKTFLSKANVRKHLLTQHDLELLIV